MSDDNPARWERLLQVILRFGEPEEIDKILRGLGNPEDVMRRNAELAEMIESKRRRAWFLKSVRDAAVWIGAVGGALMMLYGGFSFVQRHAPSQQQDDQP